MRPGLSGWRGRLLGVRFRNRPPGDPTVADVVAALQVAADRSARGDTVVARSCAGVLVREPLAELPDVVDRAVETVGLDAVAVAWQHGWQPHDLWQLSRRRQPASALSYLVDLLAADCARYSEAALAPAWCAQLRRLEAELWWRGDRPHLGQWLARARVDRRAGLELVVGVLGMLRGLPRMSELMPPPGSPAARSARGSVGSGAPPAAAGNGSSGAPEGVDPKMLTRVRALLAKAESTEFAEEADAFFAKAQELMTRYSLERAMLFAEGDGGVGSGPGGRRIWLDSPYVSAKSLLINQVASANRAKAVFHAGLGCVTVLGDEMDLELVEVLSTSLLVHASGAMVAAGRQLARSGQSRTKSFRQSFLVSYATRIGERLTAADAATAEAVASELGDGRLLPVLAARTQEVERLYETLFPELRTQRVSVSNAAGWGAGRVAADLADLDVRRAVRR